LEIGHGRLPMSGLAGRSVVGRRRKNPRKYNGRAEAWEAI
jgi:hypothetical protein